MMAGHFQLKSRIERRFESRVAGLAPRAFYVTFCTTQKVTSRSLCREHRGFPNLDSARRNGGFARTKLKPFPKGDSWFCKPRISAHKKQIRTNPIKSFCRSAAFPPPLAALFFVADATNLCASRYYRRLRRFFSALRRCPFRDSTLRVLFGAFCLAKST